MLLVSNKEQQSMTLRKTLASIKSYLTLLRRSTTHQSGKVMVSQPSLKSNFSSKTSNQSKRAKTATSNRIS